MKKDMLKPLGKVDPQVKNAIEQERKRQEGINLIASESYAPQAVLEAMSCVMTNKYAEGYPGQRYYGGCENVDTVETLAIQRAKKVFGADHVNVQPHSGTQANMAVYTSVLNPGDTILGMELSHGGHLSHGHPVNFSGQLFNARHYTVSKETGKLDYNEIAAVARKVKPDLIVCGYSAYPRTIDFNAFREIADDVDAYLLADIAHIAGLIAADVHPSPVGKADFITATTHKTIQGPRGGFIMCKQQYADDIDKAVFPGTQGGPLMHIIAAKAVAFKRALDPEWQQMQAQIIKNAKSLGKALQDHQFNLSSGGTDNHLMLVDLRNKNITGKETETILNEVDITLNKNTIPYDPRSPKVTSGVRIGTPCVTMRGMKNEEMKKIAQYIAEIIDNPEEETVKQKIRGKVQTLCNQFPVYKDDA